MGVDWEEVGLEVTSSEDDAQSLNEVFAKRSGPVVHVMVFINIGLASYDKLEDEYHHEKNGSTKESH